jgi:hypothetical protein
VASVAVSAGVMRTGADNTSFPTQIVNGAEAVAAIVRVEQLAGVPPPGGQGQAPAAEGPK